MNLEYKKHTLISDFVSAKNYKYPFYQVISNYVSHSSLKFEKGIGYNSDSCTSNSCLLDSADRNRSFLVTN